MICEQMKRPPTLVLLMVLALVFLATQLYLFYVYHDRPIQHPFKLTIRENSQPGKIAAGLTYSSYNNTKDVASVIEKHGCPIFLIDTFVLYTLLNGSSRIQGDCRFLCQSQTVTTLAVLGVLWKNGEKVTESLRSQHFDVAYVTEVDPRELSVTKPKIMQHIVTHYIFQRNSHTVHVVVIYDRGSDLWWYGCLLKNTYAHYHGDIDNIKLDRLEPSYSLNAGLLNRVEFIKVTIDGLNVRAPRYPIQLLKQFTQSTFLECNYTHAMLFSVKHEIEDNMETRTFRKVAAEILQRAGQALDSVGIPFWLSSGTCLGWFRQCDTIAYSLDVDIGVWISDLNEGLIPAMKTHGFHMKHLLGKVSDSYQLSFQAGGLKLDIFFFYEEDDYVWNGATDTATGAKYKYIFPKFNLCWTFFLNMKVRVPCDTVSYIKANYGENWFEQRKEWDWKSSPSNVQPNGRWIDSEFSEIIQKFDDAMYE